MRARHFLTEAYSHEKTVANFGEQILTVAQRRNDLAVRPYIIGLGDERVRRMNGRPSSDGKAATWKADFIEKLVKQIEAADPTPKKAYVRHLVKWYIDGGMYYIEDAAKAIDPLKLYAKFRNRELPNLGEIGFSDLLDLGDELAHAKSGSEEDKATEQGFYDRKEATLLLNNDTVKVIVPHSWEASKYFGRGTRWCTASDHDEETFYGYANQGNLYIILFKGTNDRWQFHPATNAYMDARDVHLTEEQTADVIDRYIGPLLCSDRPTADEADCQIVKRMTHPTPQQVTKCIDYDPRCFAQLISRLDPDPGFMAKISRKLQLRCVNAEADAYHWCSYKKDPEFITAVIEGHGFGKITMLAGANLTDAQINRILEYNATELVFLKNPTDNQVLASCRHGPSGLQHKMKKLGRFADSDFTQQIIRLREKIVERNHRNLPVLPDPYCWEKELQLLALRTFGPNAANSIMAPGMNPQQWLSHADDGRSAPYDAFYPEVVELYKSLLYQANAA